MIETRIDRSFLCAAIVPVTSNRFSVKPVFGKLIFQIESLSLPSGGRNIQLILLALLNWCFLLFNRGRSCLPYGIDVH